MGDRTSRRVHGIGGITGKAIAFSLIGGAVYGVVKLVDLVTDGVSVAEGSDEGGQQPTPLT